MVNVSDMMDHPLPPAVISAAHEPINAPAGESFGHLETKTLIPEEKHLQITERLAD